MFYAGSVLRYRFASQVEVLYHSAQPRRVASGELNFEYHVIELMALPARAVEHHYRLASSDRTAGPRQAAGIMAQEAVKGYADSVVRIVFISFAFVTNSYYRFCIDILHVQLELSERLLVGLVFGRRQGVAGQ